MSQRRKDPGGPVSKEVLVARGRLARRSRQDDNPENMRKARAAYWRVLAKDMYRRAALIAAAAEAEAEERVS
jgi:hypothetical protein